MKQIMLLAFLIAAGCTRPLDCDAAVDQGIKRLTAGFRVHAPDPQTLCHLAPAVPSAPFGLAV